MTPTKRVRIAFTVLAEASVILLLGSIVFVTMMFSNAQNNDSADEYIQYIHDHPADFALPDADNPPTPPEGDTPPGQGENGPGEAEKNQSGQETPGEHKEGEKEFSKDVLAGMRFFTVEIKSLNDIHADTGHILAFDEINASNAALTVYETGKSSGYYGDYRFGRFEEENGSTIIIFLDWSIQLTPSRYFLTCSLIISGIGALLALIPVFFIAKLVVKPIEIANEKQKKFISNASHELKTPLAIIKANNEIIEMTNGQDEATSTINRQVIKMTDMIRSLTALSKVGEMKRKDFVEVDLSEAYKDVVAEFKTLMEKTNKNFTFSIQDGIKMKGDETELRKLLSIFLDNARKYADTYCFVTFFKQGFNAILRVSNDTNPKMTPGPMDQVFDRFYRSDDVRGGRLEGNGIGLSIAKEIAELHKGKAHCYVTEKSEFVIQVTF